ncbi:hypothetical protein V2S04_06680 [Microbacterium sp. OR21]|uniref:hypothetical protein n=1 Tax=Microbacterium sp. OR21 TaxID=3095346 RepID=UPI0039B50554
MSDVTSSAEHPTTADEHKPMSSKLLRGAIWIAIGALIAAALVCVVWVLIGDQDGIIGRAFLTILLLALFAGVAIAEAHLAERRPDWLALASMVSWIIVLLVGAVKIWLPHHIAESFGWVGARFFQFLLVIAILQLALVHLRLFVKASRRYVTTFTRVIVIVTFAMLAGLIAMLVFHLSFPDQFVYDDLYWRIVIALAILAAVGTTLIPLLNALFAPRGPRPAPAVAPQQQMWPTYADGRTPLPVLPDGTPDFNAYYTGRPTYAPQQQASSFPTLEAAQYPYGQGGSPSVAPRVETTPDAGQPIAHIEGRHGDGVVSAVPAGPTANPPAPPAAPAAPPAAPPAPPAAPPAPPAPPASHGDASTPVPPAVPPAPATEGDAPAAPPVPPMPPAPQPPHAAGGQQ